MYSIPEPNSTVLTDLTLGRRRFGVGLNKKKTTTTTTTAQVFAANGGGTSLSTRSAPADGCTNSNTNTDSSATGNDGERPTLLPSLVCDACAARIFPEASVHPAGEVRFRYGDDGPVTAVDVALEIPGIQVGTRVSCAQEGASIAEDRAGDPGDKNGTNCVLRLLFGRE